MNNFISAQCAMMNFPAMIFSFNLHKSLLWLAVKIVVVSRTFLNWNVYAYFFHSTHNFHTTISYLQPTYFFSQPHTTNHPLYGIKTTKIISFQNTFFFNWTKNLFIFVLFGVFCESFLLIFFYCIISLRVLKHRTFLPLFYWNFITFSEANFFYVAP